MTDTHVIACSRLRSYFVTYLLSFPSSILQPDMGKKSKYKTSVKKKTLNPEFNEVNLVSSSKPGCIYFFDVSAVLRLNDNHLKTMGHLQHVVLESD